MLNIQSIVFGEAIRVRR